MDSTLKEWNRIDSDSLGADGNFYIQSTLFGKLKVDTVNFEVWDSFWGGGPYSNRRYKLNADSGQTWVVAPHSNSTIIAKVFSVRQTIILGFAATVKRIDFLDSLSGLLNNSDYIAAGLGLVAQDFDTFTFRALHGAIINGQQYGVVTSVHRAGLETILTKASLEQNFPNPFNGPSIIIFSVPRQMHVKLAVFDILGRVVSVLTDEPFAAGQYSVRFVADQLASRIYFSVLETTGTRLARRMLLVK